MNPSSPVTYMFGSWVANNWVLYKDQGTVTFLSVASEEYAP